MGFGYSFVLYHMWGMRSYGRRGRQKGEMLLMEGEGYRHVQDVYTTRLGACENEPVN